MKKKLWIVSELFFPEETATGYYITEIARHIAQYQEVNIICGPVSYEKFSNLKSNETNLPVNINVFRVKALSLDKNFLLLRIIRFISLTLSLSYEIVKRVKKNDQVWLVTNPAFLVPVAALIAKLKQFNLTILVHDMFPENLVPVNLLTQRNIFYQLLKYIFDKSYQSADKIVACGRDMATLIESKVGIENKSKIVVIENWADVDTIYPINKNKITIYGNLNLQNKIIFQFAGNIGRLQGLDLLIEAISECSNDLLHFVFIGEGAFKNKLKEIVNTKELGNVSFLGSFSRSRQNEFLNACDMGIVSLYDSMFGLGVPSKSYNILAAGKPILYLGNKKSEIALMINEHEIGWQFEMNDKKGLINFFSSIDNNFINDINRKSIEARLVAESKYSKATILKKYDELLTSPPTHNRP